MQESTKLNSLITKNKGISPKKRVCTQGVQKKTHKEKDKEELTWPHSLQGKRGRGRKLTSDAQPTATCNREKGERQVEKEDQ